jgi:hypothetical protein
MLDSIKEPRAEAGWMLYSHAKNSFVLRERRLRFAGHCFRRIDEPAAKLVLWTPTQGRRNCGRPQLDYINQICNDTGFKADELGKANYGRPSAVAKFCQTSFRPRSTMMRMMIDRILGFKHRPKCSCFYQVSLYLRPLTQS